MRDPDGVEEFRICLKFDAWCLDFLMYWLGQGGDKVGRSEALDRITGVL